MAPLQQLNLKVPEAVAAHWRAQAAAQGLSVRDWLVAITAPTAAPAAGPVGGAALVDRVAQLEALTAELARTVAQLQAGGPAPRRSAPPSPETGNPVPAAAPKPKNPKPSMGGLSAPDGAIPTARLAEVLGLKRGSLNERLRRMGGAREGLELEGWRCIGQAVPPAGGPLRWLWVPAAG